MKIVAGEPGTAWVNDGERAWWQLVCSLQNTCGQCLQFHLQVAAWWPIPLHRGCNCQQVPVPPGTAARPFADFRAILDDMPEHRKAAAIGSSNYKLIKAGLVTWQDVVTPARIRPLREVVAGAKLSDGVLRAARIPRAIAARAEAPTIDPAALAREAEARAGVRALLARGVTKDEIQAALKAQLKARIGLKGPSGTAPTSFPTAAVATDAVLGYLKARRPEG